MFETLISIFYLARPIMFVDVPFGIGGLNFFELVTMVFSLVLVMITARTILSNNKKGITNLELSMLAFIMWCTFVMLVFYQHSNFKSYVQWILPLFTYMVLKRSVSSREQYIKLIKLLLLGFVIPLLWNFVTILQGKGLGMEIYWTGLKRYSGVYSNIHTMGHNMGLLVMVVSIYYVLTTDVLGKALKTSYKILLLLMVLIALYCLYKSQTRTVYVGLAVFMVVWLFYYNKKMLVGLILFSVIGLIGVSSKVETIFFDVKEALEGQRDIERAGSGRPFIWMHNLEIFMDVGVEKKLAGVGIGNTKSAAGVDRGTVDEGVGVVWNSHNDYLGVLMETGVVGFVIQLVIYLLIFQKIRKLSPKEKSVFLGLFCAIVAMNLLSNSYISRFGLAQMFFMILVYIELPRLKTTTEETKEAVVKNDDKRRGFQSVRLR